LLFLKREIAESRRGGLAGSINAMFRLHALKAGSFGRAL